MYRMCLEEPGVRLPGSWSLTADPFCPLLEDDEESFLSEGSLSPLSSSSSCQPSSPLSSPSLPPEGPESELLSLSLLPLSDTEPIQVGGDVFSAMDWMADKLDLGDFDLDSLIGSCDSDEPPSSPEDLLACLEREVDLDSLPLSSYLPVPEPSQSPREAEEPEVKLEPVPGVSCEVTLELDGEVDVSSAVLQPPEEDSSDSDSGISLSCSPAHSCRSTPYSRAPPKGVEKKKKKMEQNKTAATRYRQKKRVEQERLTCECSELERRNRELEERAESISREIRYLTDLLEEFRSAQQRRKSPAVSTT